MTSLLGEFEILVMLAVLRLGDRAYGTPIRREIQERGRRRVARGAVYSTLDRLEEKGMLSSRFGEPRAQRGGRARRFFMVEAEGLAAVRASRGTLRRMWDGLEEALEERG